MPILTLIEDPSSLSLAHHLPSTQLPALALWVRRLHPTVVQPGEKRIAGGTLVEEAPSIGISARGAGFQYGRGLGTAAAGGVLRVGEGREFSAGRALVVVATGVGARTGRGSLEEACCFFTLGAFWGFCHFFVVLVVGAAGYEVRGDMGGEEEFGSGNSGTKSGQVRELVDQSVGREEKSLAF